LKTLHRYLLSNLLAYLGAAIALGTFVLLAGSLARVFDLLFRNVSLLPVLQFLLYKLPQLLAYTIPMGTLVAALLVFNRLSADREIIALRASGLSLLQITALPLLLSLVLSAICLALQVKLAPDMNKAARWFLREQGVQNPAALLQPGVFNELFDGYIIYLDRREGDTVQDVHIYVLEPATGQLRQDITAEQGKLTVDKVNRRLELALRNATVITLDPQNDSEARKVQRFLAEDITFPFEYGRALGNRPLVRVENDMNLGQLLAHVQLCAENGTSPTLYLLELNLRGALALAPFSFMLIAIPLGLQLNRRETSAGLVVGILVAIGYFGWMISLSTFGNRPQLQPHLLAWVPNLICQGAGLWGLWHKR